MATQQQTQHTQMSLAFEALKKPVNQSRVNVPKILFEIDPYSAAIYGIMKSIHIAMGSGVSGGMSQVEFDILQSIRQRVLELDPSAKEVGR